MGENEKENIKNGVMLDHVRRDAGICYRSSAHIYDRHIPLVEELISREPLPAPTFWLNPEVKNFYEFTPDDVRLDNYETGSQIKNIPIAV